MLFGAATHAIVKYRPMQSMPLLGYHSVLGILGTCGLFSLFTLWCISKTKRVKLVLSISWGYLVYLGFTVPSALATYASYLGMGNYPEPLKRIYGLLVKISNLFTFAI